MELSNTLPVVRVPRPHAATGHSPFELLYGRNPRGPLDVLSEEWTEPKQGKESTVSFLLKVYERIEVARDLATQADEASKATMKTHYDRGTKERSFEIGDLVLILLPTSTNKLMAKWKGPFPVVDKLRTTTYKVRTGSDACGTKVFHINMMSRWESPSAVCLLEETAQTHEGDDIPSWKEEHSTDQPLINPQLDGRRTKAIQQLVKKFRDTFSNKPGRAKEGQISIDTGNARPISSPPYRLPQARLQVAKDEIKQLLQEGLIEESRSQWSS